MLNEVDSKTYAADDEADAQPNIATPSAISRIDGVKAPTTLIFEYGVRLDKEIEGQAALVDRQIALSNRLYNALIALSREVFATVMLQLERHDPRIGELRTQAEGLYETRREARAQDDRELYATLTKEIQKLNKERLTRVFIARKALAQELKPILGQLSTTRSEARAYRVRCEYVADGLYWASANAVLNAFTQAWKKQWPKMRQPNYRVSAQRDCDKIVDQINDRPGGITREELFGGKYRLAVEKHAGKYCAFRFRAGPNGLDVRGTVQWHRDLPTHARITEARLVRRKIARQQKFYLQFQVNLASPTLAQDSDADTREAAGLSLGWYVDGNRRRIAAINVTTRHEDAEVIYLPADVEGDLDRVEAWQAERDLSRDEIVQWLRAQSVSELPDDLSERIRSITKLPVQHVSAARMAGLAWYWHDGHADQAPELYAKLGAWRKTDAEAWERMAHVRRRAQNRRLTFYRQTASRWCQKFRLIILRDLDLKAMVDVKDEKTGEHNELGAKARAGRYVAALSELTQALMNAASREHTNLIRVTAGTVEKCSVCGFDILELREHVVATCTNCGEQLERRTNASANLRRYADENRDEITAKVGEALNEANRMLSKRSENKAKRTSARIESARIKREEKAARAGSERAP